MSTIECETLVIQDPRVEVFCHNKGPEIFRSVAQVEDIWTPDPLDVPTIHLEARDRFASLLHRARADSGNTQRGGRILLLKGQGGSGKTHLMRAFRNETHRLGAGYFGYMQMTTACSSYSRYMLHKLIDSLDQPYYRTLDNNDLTTGLQRLSNMTVELQSVSPTMVCDLREDGLTDDKRIALVNRMVEDAQEFKPISNARLYDLLKALLYLQSSNVGIRARAMKYLRGEEMSRLDRDRLDIAQSMHDGGMALETIARLGQLIDAIESAALVICVDQLEDFNKFEDGGRQFARAMQGVKSISDQLPNSVIVVSCLEEYYALLRQNLDTPTIDRVEKDPAPLTLKAELGLEDIVALVQKQLQFLFDACEVDCVNANSIFPIPQNRLQELVGGSARHVLSSCKSYRDQCIVAGRLVDEGESGSTNERSDGEAGGTSDGENKEVESASLDQFWNDFLNDWRDDLPDDEGATALVLEEAILRCSEEIDGSYRFDADTNGNQLRACRYDGKGTAVEALQIGVCNRSPQGGHLGRQIEKVLDSAGQLTPPAMPVVTRGSDYTPKGKGEIAKTFAPLYSAPGRYVILGDTDMRAMQAMQTFRREHSGHAGFACWLRQAKPLVKLRTLRQILDLDNLPVPTRALEGGHGKAREANPLSDTIQGKAKKEPHVESKAQQEAHAENLDGKLHVGRTTGFAQTPVDIDADRLLTHVAFLGATKSGKTTAALNIIEQLILRGIPVILVDRKGDLVSYAREQNWLTPPPDPSLHSRKSALREKIDTVVYTPAYDDGNPIRLSVVPDGMNEMKPSDREVTARQAAGSIASMLGHKARGTDATRTSILFKAIELLGEYQAQPIDFEMLIGFIAERGTELINATGGLHKRHFDKLVEELTTFQNNKSVLFPASAASLRAEELFAIGQFARPGKTRMSIISTRWLGDSLHFWVAQLLLELGRWANKRPCASLQAAVLFDEANIYLPAVEKPTTKEPMENLLRRARSAGLGVFLATQSPGDFDYKCRENILTWFLGKIKEDTAIRKMRPMLSEFDSDVGPKLSKQESGDFFYVESSVVRSIRGQRSAIDAQQVPDHEIIEIAARCRTNP